MVYNKKFVNIIKVEMLMHEIFGKMLAWSADLLQFNSLDIFSKY